MYTSTYNTTIYNTKKYSEEKRHRWLHFDNNSYIPIEPICRPNCNISF